MTITLLQLDPIYDDDGLEDRRRALIEIENGEGAFELWVGNVPAGYNKAQAQTWLEANFDRLYAVAQARNEPPPDFFENPKLNNRILIAALALVVLDEINTIRVDELGISARTLAQLKAAVKEQYKQLNGN